MKPLVVVFTIYFVLECVSHSSLLRFFYPNLGR